MASSPSERYADFLAARGRRLTAHAARVVEIAFVSPGEFGGEDVIAGLHGQISRATVFRTLTGLEDAGLLRRVGIKDGSPVYAVIPDVKPDDSH